MTYAPTRTGTSGDVSAHVDLWRVVVLTGEEVEASDVVVTMGCGDACPFFPGTRYLDWPLDDPAGPDLDTVRRIRDDVGRRVEGLLADLPAAGAGD